MPNGIYITTTRRDELGNLVRKEFTKRGYTEQEYIIILTPLLRYHDALQVVRKLAQLLRRKRAYAKEKGKAFDLDLLTLVALYVSQDRLDYYYFFTGKRNEMQWISGRQGHPNDYVMSIDAINPDLGYIKSNVVLTTWASNRSKGQMSPTEFLHLFTNSKRNEIKRLSNLHKQLTHFGINL